MRFLRWMLLIWLLMIVLLSTVLVRSRTYAQDDRPLAYGLALCDRKPCFMGIVPIVSLWKDAILSLKNHLLAEQDDAASALFNNILVTMGRSTDGIVTGIDLLPNDGTNLGFSLGDTILLMGTPCAVGFPAGYSHPRIFYPSLFVDVLLPTDRLDPAARVDTVMIVPEDEAEYCASNEDLPSTKWKGFATVSHYLDDN